MYPNYGLNQMSMVFINLHSILIRGDSPNQVDTTNIRTINSKTGETGLGITAHDAGVLSIEVKNHIIVAIAVRILESPVDRRGFSRSKEHCAGINGGGIEIKGVTSRSAGGENGYRYHAMVIGVNGVGEAARFDVNDNRPTAATAGNMHRHGYIKIYVERPLVSISVSLKNQITGCRVAFIQFASPGVGGTGLAVTSG